MENMRLDFEPALEQLDVEAWHEQMDAICEEHGHVDPLTENVTAYFLDAGTTLLVSFETIEQIKGHNEDSAPLGALFAREYGWSSLNIVADKETWFRDETFYRYFDRLTDDGFFDDFDTVLFYGIGSCGYAACAFSVASPNAKVLAIRPQATLNVDQAGWDRRFVKNRIQDFQTRYGYAPDMLEAANKAFIAFDPLHTLDSSHAALFRAQNVDFLRLRGSGDKTEDTLSHYGIIDKMLLSIANSTFTQAEFARLVRKERGGAVHLQRFVGLARFYKHEQVAANVCAIALEKNYGHFFKRTLSRLAGNGITPTIDSTPNDPPKAKASA